MYEYAFQVFVQAARLSGLLEKAKVGVTDCLGPCFERVGFADAKEARVDSIWFLRTDPRGISRRVHSALPTQSR